MPTAACGGPTCCRCWPGCRGMSISGRLVKRIRIDAAGYQRVLETADTICTALGYERLEKIGPPIVPIAAAGLYWIRGDKEPVLIHADAGVTTAVADGELLDTRLHRLGLTEVSRQHFKIPVTASEGLLALMGRVVDRIFPCNP